MTDFECYAHTLLHVKINEYDIINNTQVSDVLHTQPDDSQTNTNAVQRAKLSDVNALAEFLVEQF